MICLLLYDKDTGRLKGQMMCPEDVREHLQDGTIQIDENGILTQQEWDLGPGRWWKVDLVTMALVDLDDDELRKAQMLKADAPLPARPTMAQRGRLEQ